MMYGTNKKTKGKKQSFKLERVVARTLRTFMIVSLIVLFGLCD